MLRGACGCEHTKYEVADQFAYAMNCHCSNCRRTTGSAFKPFGGIAADKCRIIAGEADLLKYGDNENFDLHCGRCGSLLYSVLDNGARVHIAFGTLIDTPNIKPDRHIFVGSKAVWHDITDDLPQHDEFG